MRDTHWELHSESRALKVSQRELRSCSCAVGVMQCEFWGWSPKIGIAGSHRLEKRVGIAGVVWRAG